MEILTRQKGEKMKNLMVMDIWMKAGENKEADCAERDGDLDEAEIGENEEVDDSIFGELMDQLQMKEIGIGEMQIENEELYMYFR